MGEGGGMGETSLFVPKTTSSSLLLYGTLL